MDDHPQLLASVAAGDLLAFRASQFRSVKIQYNDSSGGIQRFQKSSSGYVLSPRYTMWIGTLSVLPVASVTPDIQRDFPLAAATITGFPFGG
ncbi:hypothetical protein B0H14DRAFT_3461255 [Mycena olivaceomarginata]|nr:hypothetical protein B0H14DRAFT_3461255 [Mycena olivaceomarginata]